MTNWKGCGRKRSWPGSKVSPGIRLEGLRKATKNQSGQPACGSIFEPRTSQILERSAGHSTTTFGNS
jgi:hypothetical protein